MKIPFATDIAKVVNENNVGLWFIDNRNVDDIKMYGDDKFLELIGNPDLSPQDLYVWFNNNVLDDSTQALAAYTDKIRRGVPAEVIYYWRHPKKGTRLVRCNGCVFVLEDGSKIMRGIHADITEIYENNTDYSENAILSTQISSTLSRNFEAIYYINLIDDTYILLDTNMRNVYIDLSLSGVDFFKEAQDNIKRLGHKDDYDSFATFMNKDNLLSLLNAGQKFITCEYRLFNNDQAYWFRMKSSYVPGDRNHIVLTVENINDEMKAKRKEERKNKQINLFISNFLQGYQSVFVVNPLSDTYEIINESKQYFDHEHRFKNMSSAMEYYIEHYVYPSDRHVLAKFRNAQTISNVLANQNEVVAHYRDISSGDAIWQEIKAVRESDKPGGEFILGVTNKHNQIVLENISNKVFENYSSMHILDFKLKKVTTLNTGNNVFDDNDNMFSIDEFIVFFNNLLTDKTRDVFENNLNIDALRRTFRQEEHKEFLCEFKNAENGWRRVEVSVMEYENGEPITALLTFRMIDNETIEREQTRLTLISQRQEIEERTEIINGLNSVYSAMFLVDLDTEEVRSFLLGAFLKTFFEESLKRNNNYSKLMESCVSKFVKREYKHNLIEDTKISHILSRLRKGTLFSIPFVTDSNLYYEIRFIKIGNTISPKKILVGLVNRDFEMRKENDTRQVIDALSEEYSFVFLVNTDTDYAKSYRFDHELYKHFNKVQKSYNFSDIMDQITNKLIPQENREEFFKRNKKRYVLDRLITTDSFSSVNKIIVGGVESFWQVRYIKAHSFDSNSLIVAFRNIDDQIKDKVEEQKIMQRNMNIINVLASEYSSIYYFDIKNKDLIPYNVNNNTEGRYRERIEQGIKYEEALNLYVENFVYKMDKERILVEASIPHLMQVLRYRKAFTTTFRSPVADGTNNYFELKIIKVDDDDAEPTAFAIAFTERDEEILKRFIDSKLLNEFSGIYLVDLDTIEYRTIIESPFSLKDTPKRGNWEKLVSSFFDVLEVKDTLFWKSMTDTTFIRREFKIGEDRREYTYSIGKDNKQWRRAIVQVVERTNGIPSSIVVTITSLDIEAAKRQELSEEISRQKNELEIKQAELESALETAEIANKAKTTFLSNMSHDIRTPMNAIIGFTTLALKNPKDSKKIEAYLRKTETSSKYLLSLINDVLDMSRIESGKIVLEDNPASMANIVDDLTAIIIGPAGEKKINLFIDQENVVHENVLCDKLRLHQALINILGNAIKFTPDEGRVSFIVKENSCIDNKANFTFIIEDDGMGMSEEFLEKIFDPFERERTSTISKVQGTGLGMTIAKSVINMMGGTIDVKSKRGIGTKFIINVSFSLQPEIEISSDDYKGRNCFIITNDSSTENKLMNELTKHGFDTVCFADSNSAIKNLLDSAKNNKIFDFGFVDYKASLDLEKLFLKHFDEYRNNVNKELRIVVLEGYNFSYLPEDFRTKEGIYSLAKPLFPSKIDNFIKDMYNEKSNIVSVSSGSALMFKGKRCLLVEDNAINREIASEILLDLGFKVDVATDGSKAVSVYESSKPGTYDIIFMDVQMPLMNGYEATKKIRGMKNKKMANIPIIAMTANAFQEDKRDAHNAGMNAHIAKPIDINILKRVSKTLLKL